MGRHVGVEAAVLMLTAHAVGGCTVQPEHECETVYIYDPGTMRDVPQRIGCEDSGSSSASSRCDGLGRELGRVVDISSGAAGLVDTYVAADGVIVVTRDRIALFDRNGKRLASRSEKDLVTAAFDGSILVVSGADEFVSYDTALQELARGKLGMVCTSCVLVSGPRLVCGNSEENARTFATYDPLTGAFLTNTIQYAFEEGPMRRVAGRDAFLSVNTSRTLFLYEVNPAGSVQMTANSSAQNSGSFRVSSTYAFAESPATHVITDQGLLVCLTPADCGDPTFGLQPDGDVGLLPDDRYFGAMDVDSTGKLHAIVGPSMSSIHYGPTCESGCSVDRIDVASGTIEASTPFDFDEGSPQFWLRADPAGGIVLGCGDAGYPGHRVMVLPDAP